MKTSVYKLTAQGHELDSFNHVNNAVYLKYAEFARWDFFKQENILDFINSEKLFMVLLEINIRFMKEIKIFDNVIIKTKWSTNGNLIYIDHIFYLEGTNIKLTKISSKAIFITQNKIIHDIPIPIKKIIDGE